MYVPNRGTARGQIYIRLAKDKAYLDDYQLVMLSETEEKQQNKCSLT